MIIVLVVVAGIVVGTILGVWFLKRKLADMSEHLPGALQQWEKEIEKLEKPKG